MSDRLTARELLAQADREETRRRRFERRLSRGTWSLLFALVLCAELIRRFGGFGGVADIGAAQTLWATALIVSHVTVFFLAPFRTYWRPDSALLSRLPIRGGVLFRLSVMRAMRSTVAVTVPCLVGVAVMAALGSAHSAARFSLVAAVATAASSLLAPAVTLAAGATVASDRAQAVIDSFGGEFRAPKTTWLGALPGFAAAVVVLTLLVGVNWAAGNTTESLGIWVGILGVLLPALALGWALKNADRIMPAALREVAALDQERLAHVDRSTPSRIESWVAGLCSERQRLVFNKDAALLRRRFPIAYLLWAICAVAVWIISFTNDADLPVPALAFMALLVAHIVATAARTIRPPTEHLRLLAHLPLLTSDWLRAKRIYTGARLVLFFTITGLPLVLTRESPVAGAGVVIGLAFVSTIAGCLAIRE